MKKLLLLPVLMLSFNALANDVSDMTKDEVKAKHYEFYQKAMDNATLENCQRINRFDNAANEEKKLVLMDIEEGERWSSAKLYCSAQIGYEFFDDKSTDYQ